MVYRYNELEPGERAVYWVVEFFNGNVGEETYCDTEREAIDYAELHAMGFTKREAYEVYWEGYAFITKRVIELDDDGELVWDECIDDSAWSYDSWLKSREYDNGLWREVTA